MELTISYKAENNKYSILIFVFSSLNYVAELLRVIILSCRLDLSFVL